MSRTRRTPRRYRVFPKVPEDQSDNCVDFFGVYFLLCLRSFCIAEKMSVARHSKTQQPTGMTEPTHFAEESELTDSKIFAQQSIAHDGLTMRATTMRNAGSNINRSSQCDEHAAPVESRDKVSPLELTKPEQEETHREEPIMIPQSTHSLLFTQPTFSLPFFFAVLIAVLSLTCLNLAMLVSC